MGREQPKASRTLTSASTRRSPGSGSSALGQSWSLGRASKDRIGRQRTRPRDLRGVCSCIRSEAGVRVPMLGDRAGRRPSRVTSRRNAYGERAGTVQLSRNRPRQRAANHPAQASHSHRDGARAGPWVRLRSPEAIPVYGEINDVAGPLVEAADHGREIPCGRLTIPRPNHSCLGLLNNCRSPAGNGWIIRIDQGPRPQRCRKCTARTPLAVALALLGSQSVQEAFP
jgi:hypothetical protein